jgi:isopentenyldiphosphate isomerase
MEIWDLYNENRERIGKDLVRGQDVPPGCYHLVVQVWIRNSRGEYLISQRSADREVFPLMWETVGGSAVKGEDSMTAALRETKEEIGVVLKPEKGKLIFTQVGRQYRGKRYADILDVWLFSYDGEADLHSATTQEVAQTKWMTKEEIKKLFAAEKMVYTLEYFITDSRI